MMKTDLDTKPLSHGSLFTGVGGFDEGFSQSGIETRWMVEWDKHCQHVLRERYPEVPLYGDIRDVDPGELEHVDIVSFGSPCQGLSVAGLQLGLEDDERSNLFYEAIRIIRGVRPTIAVWENVPGAFTSAKGEDFASVIDSLADIGALDIGWRVLDSRYFGVPQRRRRIYLVADFGGQRAGEILALADGLLRYSPPSRASRKKPAAASGSSPQVDSVSALTKGLGSGGPDSAHAHSNWLVPELANTLRSASDSPAAHGKVNGTDRATYWDGGQLCDTLDVSQLVKGQMMPEKRRMPAVIESSDQRPVATFSKARRAASTDDFETWESRDHSPTLNAFDNGGDARERYFSRDNKTGGEPMMEESGPVVETQYKAGDTATAVALTEVPGGRPSAPTMRVRRLTPTECERLQGFPDGHTLVTWQEGGKAKSMSDSQRYRQMGNAVTVNVAAWLGRQIAAVLREQEPPE